MMEKTSENKRSYTKLWLKCLCCGNAEKQRKIKENQAFIRSFRYMIKVLFICHDNILKSPGKASKINGSMKQRGAYYITATPFLKEP